MREVQIADGGVQLCGMPWFAHNGGKLWRFPKGLQGQVSAELWECSTNTSGARLRFASDTSALGVSLDYSPYDPAEELTNMGRIGQAGVDVYADGRFWRNVVPHQAAHVEGMFFEGVTPEVRQFTLYLPLYHCVEVRHLLFAEEAAILPPAPFALPKPVVFYGTSITQGGCASRPGMSYQAMLCRELNLDFVNLGFSGLGRGEPVVAQAIAQLDAACFVLDFAQNNPTVEEFAAVYQPFIDTLRAAHPETPLLLTTPIPYTWEQFDREYHALAERRREVVRAAYRKQREAGDEHIRLLEGRDYLTGDNGDGQVDGGHPNDLGFACMARAMKQVLREAVGV